MTQSEAWVSRTVSGIEISAIKEMAIRARKVEDAASLTWGVPSFRTPEPIRAAVAAALEADPEIGKYALLDGLPALRQAVARHHEAETGIAVDPDTEVMITCGNMQGLNALFHVLIEPGDEIVVTSPGFASHIQQIRLCGGVPVHWRLDESRDWAPNLDALPGLIGPRTKGIVLVTPSNPTGRIFTESELRMVGRLAVERHVPILLDDPYSHFTYENRDRHFNLASVEALRENVLYLFTFSKSYAMSGWRVGYMILPATLKREVLKVHDATIICTPRISQVAALAGLEGDQAHLAEFEAALGRRRDLICERLDRLAHVFDYVRPQGAYYVFPRILVAHESSIQFALDLLETAKVVVTPGVAFGPEGENHIRMAFCVPDETILAAFDRLDAHFGS